MADPNVEKQAESTPQDHGTTQDQSTKTIGQDNLSPTGDLEAQKTIDKRLLLIGTVLIGFIAVLMVADLITRWVEYDSAIKAALKQVPVDHSAVLAYTRSLDAAISKTTSLMLSFLVVFVGAIYVLRSSTVGFMLNIQQQQSFSGSLQTASPGLVMVTLGLAVVVAILLVPSKVDYTAPDFQIVASPQPATNKDGKISKDGGQELNKDLGLEPAPAPPGGK